MDLCQLGREIPGLSDTEEGVHTMKRISLISIAALSLLGAPRFALADSITDTVDFATPPPGD